LHSANWQAWQSPPVAEFGQAQKALGAEDALLAYTLTEESLVIFAATDKARHFQHLNYPLKRMEADIEELCDEMSLLQSQVLGELSSEELSSRAAGFAWPRMIEDQLERLHACLEKLFAILIVPVLPVILGKKHFIIIPHGPLHRVPWAALRGAGRYLVESHSISLLPSASLGIALKSRAASESGQAIFFGNPDREHESLRLPGAEREVEAAFQVLNAGPSPFTGSSATKSALFEHAPNARLLHLACHHFFDASAPLFSFLKLAGESGSQFVYAFEVAELRLSSELVTLSACESGRSRIGTGDEQYGIVRAFLAAGARSVVSTLWNIEDDSAAALFTDFYSTAGRLGLAEALAATQRNMLKNPSYSLPNFWAPYVLSGEWNKPLMFARNN
jgi:CHAT domain-containing protein